jgi:hypothetical protein
MTDVVTYKLPYGFIGTMAHNLVVKRDIEKIFDFRHRLLEARFGKI